MGATLNKLSRLVKLKFNMAPIVPKWVLNPYSFLLPDTVRYTRPQIHQVVQIVMQLVLRQRLLLYLA